MEVVEELLDDEDDDEIFNAMYGKDSPLEGSAPSSPVNKASSNALNGPELYKQHASGVMAGGRALHVAREDSESSDDIEGMFATNMRPDGEGLRNRSKVDKDKENAEAKREELRLKVKRSLEPLQ